MNRFLLVGSHELLPESKDNVGQTGRIEQENLPLMMGIPAHQFVLNSGKEARLKVLRSNVHALGQDGASLADRLELTTTGLEAVVHVSKISSVFCRLSC